jgi:hypothetical protein
MQEEVFVSADGGLTRKGPLPLLLLQSMHEGRRFSEGTCVLEEEQWVPLLTFLDSRQEQIEALHAQEQQTAAAQRAADQARIKKAGLRKIGVGVIVFLIGGIAVAAKLMSTPIDLSYILLQLSMLGIGFWLIAQGLLQWMRPEDGFT